MRASWPLAAGVVLLAASTAVAQSDPRGLYVYSWQIATTFAPTQLKAPGVAPLLSALDTDGIDGITLVFDWSAIEPAQGSFMWSGETTGTTRLDLWIQEAMKAGKHVILAISTSSA